MSDDLARARAKAGACHEALRSTPGALSFAQAPGEIASPPFERGQLIGGRYRVERRLGVSACVERYRVFDRELRESVVLKAIPAASPCTPGVQMLFAEARQTRLIKHPNVCRVHDVGVHPKSVTGCNRVYFSTMELIDGRRLSNIVADRGAVELPAALTVARQVLGGLEAAHRAGVHHRRLDGRRVLISGSLAAPTAHIIDFGLPEITELSTADERRAGLALDLRGVGLLLLEMLTGQRTEPATWLASLELAVTALASRVPAHVAEVLRRSLAPEGSDRFGKAQELLALLSR